VHSTALVTILNKIFVEAIAEGELDFLLGKVLQLNIKDANLDFYISLVKNKLCACGNYKQAYDVRIEGNVHDFLLLATRREDPDTLFFNRRLRLSGDTELGLYIKNFLDSLEPEEFGAILKVLEHTLNIFENVGNSKLVNLLSNNHKSINV
jgi:predicted lipid carrier protein YhbT